MTLRQIEIHAGEPATLTTWGVVNLRVVCQNSDYGQLVSSIVWATSPRSSASGIHNGAAVLWRIPVAAIGLHSPDEWYLTTPGRTVIAIRGAASALPSEDELTEMAYAACISVKRLSRAVPTITADPASAVLARLSVPPPPAETVSGFVVVFAPDLMPAPTVEELKDLALVLQLHFEWSETPLIIYNEDTHAVKVILAEPPHLVLTLQISAQINTFFGW